jgi:hypothetical protein
MLVHSVLRARSSVVAVIVLWRFYTPSGLTATDPVLCATHVWRIRAVPNIPIDIGNPMSYQKESLLTGTLG